MKEIQINNEKVIIRKGLKSDSKSLIEYLNIIGGQSDFLTFGADEYPKAIEQIEEFIESTSKKDNALFIVAELNGKIVGNLNFSAGLSPRITHVGEFGVSVLKEYWGNGIGEELIKYLIEWSKKSEIIRKINLRVRADNIRGINLYKKLGFLEEGTLTRDFFINGKFYDSIAMGLIID
ncbi:GNAT family N-acetyltransferase [Clostridium sp. ZS2-4]|uniref:GNAT family N-acetyltransferase n=1 Tax=Clostridium sp. ZS2-4 TaxID=2987703 RepID=UPI00227C68D8|nr:GNAT family protein [Clostridium sp. ZS2-4]MCY6355937.1 GNAT family protein [Clostridium sp. ZS2-4]